jgi:tetratricopeptide (TPR) repeat protein
MTIQTQSRDRFAETYLQILSEADDQYGSLPGDQKELLLTEFAAGDWGQVVRAYDWAREMKTPAATRCCALISQAGATILSMLLPLPERVEWLEAAVAALRNDRLNPEPALDPARVPAWETNALGNLGIAYRDQQRFRDAARTQISCLRASAGIADSRSRRAKQAIILGNLSVNFIALEKLERADECIRAALDALTGDGSVDSLLRANLWINQGLVQKHRCEKLLRAGDHAGARAPYEAARSAYVRALRVARRIGSVQALTDASGNLGDLFLLLGRARRAELLYRCQLVLARQGAKLWSEGNAQRGIALARAAQGDVTGARAILSAALATFEKAGEAAPAEEVRRAVAALG